MADCSIDGGGCKYECRFVCMKVVFDERTSDIHVCYKVEYE